MAHTMERSLSAKRAVKRQILRALRVQGEEFMKSFDNARPATPVQRLQPKATLPVATRQVQDQALETGAKNSDSETSATQQPQQRVAKRQRLTTDLGVSRSHSQQQTAQTAVLRPGLSPHKAKRLFLAGRSPEVAHEKSGQKAQLAVDSAQDDASAAAQLRDMGREVGALGVLGLDKRQQKAHNAERLRSLKLAPEKGPRTPASIGKRKVANRVKRERTALEEGVQAGMVQLKGMGKRKQRQRDQAFRQQKSLYEDGGAFKNGKLDLKLARRLSFKRKRSK